MKNNFEKISVKSIKTTLNIKELPEKPDAYDDDVENFLDFLKDYAEINMLGAPPLLVETFGFDKKTAREVTAYYFKICEARVACY